VKVVEGTVTKLIKEMRHGQETVVGVEYKAKDGLKVRFPSLPDDDDDVIDKSLVGFVCLLF
jgi:HKD family nuclease